jgi:hypothetical protein
MNKSKMRLGVLSAMLFALLVVVAAPSTTSAQGNGHGRGRGHNRGEGWKLDKKSSKFVNGHDARDGRVDGRGRRRNNLAWRNEGFVPRGYRVRNRQNNNGRSTWTLAQRRAYVRRNR